MWNGLKISGETLNAKRNKKKEKLHEKRLRRYYGKCRTGKHLVLILFKVSGWKILKLFKKDLEKLAKMLEKNTNAERQRKRETSSNYRPDTCLPVVWKVLTSVMEEKNYEFLGANVSLTKEQKGCRRKFRGTNDLLFIGKKTMWEVKIRKRNISIARIDYKKAYDIMPHSWIINGLETVQINETIGRLLAENIKSWWVECGEENLEKS